jgi:subtilisin family serine protease
MKKTTIKSLVFAVLVGALVTSCQQDEQIITPDDNMERSSSSQIIPGQYIVVYNTARTGHAGRLFLGDRENSARFVRERINEIFESNQLQKPTLVQVFSQTINGVALKLTDRELTLLRKDSRVAYIEQDQIITLAPPKAAAKPPGGGTSPQETPWGITRVNGVSNYTGSNVAWIIDTGIDFDHPDLNVDVSRSASFLTSGGPSASSAEDENGHGTHVAGTIGAYNNSIGVIGVAPGAKVVAVRVLNRQGSGSYSGVIAGVDYVGSSGRNGDVANMSLGGPVSQALDDAVVAASANGIKFCLAAGNESDDANNHSPARANGTNVYTISAMSQGDKWASFSNFGNPPIDYCAPGVAVKSTWKDGGYNTISGTSMATPHAAGVLLLGSAKASGKVSGDPDGNPDNIISH